jgi:outer membrane immunogenic protein
MFHKTLLATAAVVAMSSAAFAADLPTQKGPPVYAPPPPVFTWTGVYIGAQVGYEWGYTGTTLAGVGAPSYNPNGIVGGGHIGYNYQFSGPFVVGLEGDVNGSNYRGRNITGATIYGSSTPIDGSLRGRIGYAYDRALFYVTGGGALGDFKNSYTVGGATDTLYTTRIGWTAGAGIDYAIDNNWSIGVEYRYTNYGTYSQFSPTALGAAATAHQIDNRVQAGFSYKFDLGGPVLAKY